MGVQKAFFWIVLSLALALIMPINTAFADSLKIISPESKTYSQPSVMVNISYDGNGSVTYQYDDKDFSYDKPHDKLFPEGTHKLKVYVDEDLKASVSFTIKEEETIVLDESMDFIITINEDGIQGMPDNPFSSYIWMEIPAYQECIMNVRKDLIGVTKLTFSPRKEMGKVSVYVELLDGKPKGIERPSDNTYQFIKISKSGIENIDFKGGVYLEFKIDEKWVVQNSVNIDNVRLLHHDGTAWQILNTNYVKKDYDYYYYTAWTPGLSYFAIAEIDDKPAEKGETGGEVAENTSEGMPEEEAIDNSLNPVAIDEDLSEEDDARSDIIDGIIDNIDANPDEGSQEVPEETAAESQKGFTEITGGAVEDLDVQDDSGKIYLIFMVAVTIIALGMTGYVMQNRNSRGADEVSEAGPGMKSPMSRDKIPVQYRDSEGYDSVSLSLTQENYKEDYKESYNAYSQESLNPHRQPYENSVNPYSDGMNRQETPIARQNPARQDILKQNTIQQTSTIINPHNIPKMPNIPPDYLARLTSYIESRLERGQQKEDIKKILRVYGWDPAMVDMVMQRY